MNTPAFVGELIDALVDSYGAFDVTLEYAEKKSRVICTANPDVRWDLDNAPLPGAHFQICKDDDWTIFVEFHADLRNPCPVRVRVMHIFRVETRLDQTEEIWNKEDWRRFESRALEPFWFDVLVI